LLYPAYLLFIIIIIIIIIVKTSWTPDIIKKRISLTLKKPKT